MSFSFKSRKKEDEIETDMNKGFGLNKGNIF